MIRVLGSFANLDAARMFRRDQRAAVIVAAAEVLGRGATGFAVILAVTS